MQMIGKAGAVARLLRWALPRGRATDTARLNKNTWLFGAANNADV